MKNRKFTQDDAVDKIYTVETKKNGTTIWKATDGFPPKSFKTLGEAELYAMELRGFANTKASKGKYEICIYETKTERTTKLYDKF